MSRRTCLRWEGGLQGWGVGAEKDDEASPGSIGWNGRKSTGEGGAETQRRKGRLPTLESPVSASLI